MTSRIVIIGGGQASGWAAKTLRDEGFDGEICVVAEEEWDFYERPPLSKASLLEPDSALPRLFSEEAQQALNLIWYRPLRAESVDREEKIVRLSNGECLSYNILLIATGGAPAFAGVGQPSAGLHPAPLAGRAAPEKSPVGKSQTGDYRRRLDWP